MVTNRLTQKQRLLRLLRERGVAGVKVWEFTLPIHLGGCGVMQYNARILELRRSGYNIINKKPGHFVLIEYKEVEIENGEEIVNQLAFT